MITGKIGKSINLNGSLINLSEPLVMGIINVTPDSFYEKSRVQTSDNILAIVENMIFEGANIIDIGAVSSRPGAKLINENEEIDRLFPLLESIRMHFPDIYLSVDTFRASVARKAVENYKVAIINDISGGLLDAAMLETIGQLKVVYILMHMRGTPENMQQHTQYNNILHELFLYFSGQLHKARSFGINDIIIDPGFGFGKTLEQNYFILNNLRELEIFNVPVLVGVSRKSMIYKLLNTIPEQSLQGTTALHMAALINGARILRVHDVKPAVEVVKLYKQLINKEI